MAISVYPYDVLVSVYCLAYNHEKYIRDALEGFIKQKTNFQYEVIIHDDASTDNTATIIKEYEKKYPEIIKGIYQKENQYSQGVDIFKEFIYPRIKGKYIAICEGDDCWIDDNKLQIQFDALEQHPECDMCAHRAKWLDCKDNKTTKVFPDIQNFEILNTETIIYRGGGFLPTASLFFRKEVMINPMGFQKVWNIDYSLQIRGSLRGGTVFIPETMALYRWNTEQSWTSRNNNFNAQKRIFEKKTTMLNMLDEETCGRYNTIISKTINRNILSILIQEHNCIWFLKKENRKFLHAFSSREIIKIFLNGYFPFFKDFLRKIKTRKY